MRVVVHYECGSAAPGIATSQPKPESLGFWQKRRPIEEPRPRRA
jgi:hypothetical protein